MTITKILVKKVPPGFRLLTTSHYLAKDGGRDTYNVYASDGYMTGGYITEESYQAHKDCFEETTIEHKPYTIA